MNEEITTVGLQSPWVTIWYKLKTMFEHDTEIEISDIIYPTDEDNNKDDNGCVHYLVNISTQNPSKRAALRKLLPHAYEFGNIILDIDVLEADETDDNLEITGQDFFDLFEGNYVFFNVISIEDPFGIKHEYAVFSRIVASFYNDDISDPWGMWNGLYEDIARAIFVPSAIQYGTRPASNKSNDFI